MDYLLDTNIIITLARSRDLANKITKKYELFNSKNSIAVSVVTLGELDSLIRQFKYGQKRQQEIERLLGLMYKIDIHLEEIIERYGEIDAFSQNKLVNKPLKISARNMGKNDIWIAATASVYDMILLTMDKDFEHLNVEFLDLEIVEI